MRRFYEAYLRSFLTGFHAAVAMIATFIVVFLVSWTVGALTGVDFGKNSDNRVPWWHWVVSLGIGLPLFGYFISNGPEYITRHLTKRGEVRNGKWRRNDPGNAKVD